MMDFLVELFLFLGSRWKLWVRPIVIFLLIIALLMLAAWILEWGFAPGVDDELVPFSRNHYRHDAVLFNKYSAISLCPSRFG